MRAEAIIPARGDSKRVPGKNTRMFCGKPMLAWSIEAARCSGIFDTISVSTDCPAIARVARAHGAQVHESLRPAALSGDQAGLLGVMQYESEIRHNRPNQADPDALCFILATAPFTSADSLRQGQALVQDPRWDYALAATTFAAPLDRAFHVSAAGGTEMLVSGAYARMSNDMPEAWHDAGQFYWGRFKNWLEPTPGFFGPRTTIVPRPRHLCQDIDSEEDWQCAERLFQVFGKGE